MYVLLRTPYGVLTEDLHVNLIHVIAIFLPSSWPQTTLDHIPCDYTLYPGPCTPPYFIMAEMQNSNPTILNAADLPTRLRPTATRKSEYAGIFTSALPLAPVDFESVPSSDSEDDNLLEEPIDEQEIYGKALSCISREKKERKKKKSHISPEMIA